MKTQTKNQHDHGAHGRRLVSWRRTRKAAHYRGTFLPELAIAAFLLVFVGVWTLRTNLQTLRPRNWAMVQAITDAYMTQHLAEAESIDFTTLVDPAPGVSPWPDTPMGNVTPGVVVGRLPARTLGGTTFPGAVITGTLFQIRTPAPNNLPAAGGTGTTSTNPAQIEAWLVQTHLTYSVGGRDYVKTRNTVRTR